jgi:hypothetical protein
VQEWKKKKVTIPKAGSTKRTKNCRKRHLTIEWCLPLTNKLWQRNWILMIEVQNKLANEVGIDEQCRCYKNQDLSTVHNSTRPSLAFHFQPKTINITGKPRGRNCSWQYRYKSGASKRGPARVVPCRGVGYHPCNKTWKQSKSKWVVPHKMACLW